MVDIARGPHRSAATGAPNPCSKVHSAFYSFEVGNMSTSITGDKS